MDKMESHPSWSKWYQPGSEDDAAIYASALQKCKDINEQLNSQPWWDSQQGLVATKVIESAPIWLKQPKAYSAAWVEGLISKESKRIKDKQASKKELLQKVDSSAQVLIKIATQLKPVIDIFIPESPEYSIPYACLWAIFKGISDRKEKLDSVQGLITSLSHDLPILEGYKDMFPTNDMKQALTEFYIHTLDLLWRLSMYYSHNFFKIYSLKRQLQITSLAQSHHYASELFEIWNSDAGNVEDEFHQWQALRFSTDIRDHWSQNGILPRLAEWRKLCDDYQKNSILWISTEGNGRQSWLTEFSTNLIDICRSQSQAITFAMCDRPMGVRWTPQQVLKQLLLQLLNSRPSLTVSAPDVFNARRFRKADTFHGVLQLLRATVALLGSVVIVIDRLDRCALDTAAQEEDIIQALCKLVNVYPRNLRVIVTTGQIVSPWMLPELPISFAVDLTKILLLIKSTLNNQDLKSEIIVKIHDSIALCEGGIVNLNNKLQKIKVSDVVGDKLRSQARRAIYPFKKSTLIKLQEIVGDLQERLHLTLTTLGVNISLQNFEIVSGQLEHLSIEANKTQVRLGNIQNSLADLDRKIDTRESLINDQHVQNFCKELSPIFDLFEKRQHDIFRLPGRQDGTWEWLQGTQEFQNWLAGTDRILWCPGQPGVGKTVLSNALLTVPNFISNLLQQLFRQSPKIPNELLNVYKSYTKGTVHLGLEKCSAFLRDVVESFSQVLIVVDGLDECPHREIDDIRGELLDHLKELPLRARLLFTSRDLPAIALQFAVDQRLEIHASRHAIEGYLQARIDNSKNLSRHIQRKPSLRQAIVDMVAKKADGMFLLVRMYIDLVATKKVLGMVESTLRNLPEGLKELDTAYDDVITRIENQDDDDVIMAKQILTWLYYAARPLTLVELRHSLATNLASEADPDATELDEAFLPDEEVIVSVCAGIVTCHAESNTVSFIHYTTKEYFKRRMDRQDVERFLHLEISIAETCLIYLIFERKEFEQYLATRPEYSFLLSFSRYAHNNCPSWDIDICYPLFRYAARYWGDHAKDTSGQAAIKDLFVKFERQRTGFAASVQALAEQEYKAWRFPILISGFCLASFFGLKDMMMTMMLSEDCQHIDAKNEFNWTALHMAARRGNVEIAQLLIDNGADINAAANIPPSKDFGTTALHWAAKSGDEKMVELLLRNNADMDLQRRDGKTALFLTVLYGHVGVVRLLVNKGANMELKNEDFAPLGMAALMGDEAAAEILIEGGAELSTAAPEDSLLMCAAVGGNAVVARRLLEKGVDVNIATFDSEIALWAAALDSDPKGEKIVKLLLKEGADVSKRTDDQTALHISAYQGCDTTVSLILESGAEIGAQNKYGETALHIAAKKSPEALFQLHDKYRADVTVMTKARKIALQLAASNDQEDIVQYLIEYLDCL
ncbi:hypothetical protein ACQKWADRAFT_322360 [Trichoderma austrokoningii]